MMETWKPSHAHVSSTSPSPKSHIPTSSLTVQRIQHAQSVIRQIIVKKIAFSNISHQYQNFNHRNSHPRTGIDH